MKNKDETLSTVLSLSGVAHLSAAEAVACMQTRSKADMKDSDYRTCTHVVLSGGLRTWYAIRVARYRRRV